MVPINTTDNLCVALNFVAITIKVIPIGRDHKGNTDWQGFATKLTGLSVPVSTEAMQKVLWVPWLKIGQHSLMWRTVAFNF